MKRVFYVGELWEGGTCLERAKVIAEQGWEVIHFDITPYLRSHNRIQASLQHRLLAGPDVWRLNKDLLQCIRSTGRVNIIWIDKGRWVWPSTLQELKRRTGALAVHFTPDPAFTVHTSRHFDACVPLYDLCVTNKRYELDRYQSAGAKEVIFTWQGIDDRFIRIEACGHLNSQRKGAIFIGHVEPYYVKTLESVVTACPELIIRGHGWDRVGRRRAALRGFTAGPVWGDQYVMALAGAKIGIGLLSKLSPDQFTTRSFEIPAAGAMLLAERTAEHLELFEEGSEAIFFTSTRELVDKIRFYMRAEDTRRRIAEAGRHRVLSNYHWRNVLRPALKLIQEQINN